MYKIRKWKDDLPVIWAAYEIIEGTVFFDNRGNSEFIQNLMKEGVPFFDEKGNLTRRILPMDGIEFHEACQNIFCTSEWDIVNEEELREIRKKFSCYGDSGNSDYPPAMAC